MPELLRASHAKPWKDCTDAERVDPYNGFLLEARYDALFDQGFISFADDGALLVSPCLGEGEARRLGIPLGLRIQGLALRRRACLRWHRERVFRASSMVPVLRRRGKGMSRLPAAVAHSADGADKSGNE